MAVKTLCTMLWLQSWAAVCGFGQGPLVRSRHSALGGPAARLSLGSETQLSLEDGDLVEYRLPTSEAGRLPDGKRLGIGCVSRGQIHPLCKWSEETDEWLFDEEAAPLGLGEAERALDMNQVWFSNRLVGGGMGPGNPHGEESEDCWGLADVELSADTRLVVRPEREVWW